MLSGYEVDSGEQRVHWDPYPAAEAYQLLSASSLEGPWEEDTSGVLDLFRWSGPVTGERAFHRLAVTPMAADKLLASIVLNRLAYGPTPDEWDRVWAGAGAIGPQAYIDEQLAPELIVDPLDEINDSTNWTYMTATGTIQGNYMELYLSGAGHVRIDDLVLVAGTEPEVGVNLLENGDFEAGTLDPWVVSSNYTGSYVDSSVSHGGTSCLWLEATAQGGNTASRFYQGLTNKVTNGQSYTLSYWYLPDRENGNRNLTVRLAGNRAVASHNVLPFPVAGALHPLLENRSAQVADLRAWFALHAVHSRRQLLEILLQFLDNHFVTQWDKTYTYLGRYYQGGSDRDAIATYLEYREISRWRDLLLRPDGTFLDLLRVSAESPAMIIYLDTVDSRGDGNRIANENYARELLELFCNGVDNGYDQTDIVEISKAWTGWTIDIVDEANIDNPFAPRSTTLIDTNNIAVRSNLFGVWTLHYDPRLHHTNSKSIFPGRTVPARFGAPWAGRNYELTLPSRAGQESIQDGYDIVEHLADLPFTQEYISVKLCRLFVHDDFDHGTYDYSDPNRSAEAELVRQCMLAWEEGSPKGQVRDVLQVIFQSDLFRGHGSASHKVKTPLEFVVSTLRTMKSSTEDGTPIMLTDGYSLTGTGRNTDTVPLARMGGMFLFDRVEPDGYPESGSGWISAGTLAERIRFVQSFCIAAGQSGHSGGQSGLGNDAGTYTRCDPVALLKTKLDEASWPDSEAVANWFIGRLYPAEGMGNLAEVKAAAVGYLDMDDDGVTPSPLSGLSPDSSDYEIRVRGMVAMLMALPLFQEQ